MRADQAERRQDAADGAGGSHTLGRDGNGAATADPTPGSMNPRAIAMPDDLLTLYAALIDADDRGDATSLAGLGWSLFAIASTARQGHRKAADLLAELRAAASAAYAGNGSPASLELLRHILAKHGWLPEPGATPLQALAAPPGTREARRCSRYVD
jgi:hypothetical protein